jgi:hypothetical protein
MTLSVYTLAPYYALLAVLSNKSSICARSSFAGNSPPCSM